MTFKQRSVSGYTLVEVLVVLFIISIVTSVALLSIRRNDNKEMETFAHEVTQILSLAEEQAMLTPSVLGLSFDKEFFQFASLEKTKDGKKTTWAPLADTILGTHPIPRNVEVRVSVANQNPKSNSRIVISTNGEVTPFTIYIGKPGQKPRYAISGHADGTVKNKFIA